MFILGDLIAVPLNEPKLPLPWWHRAPLAFESGTQVTLAVTHPKEDRPGDLLVSVINPNKWPQSYRIRCFYQDKPGIVAKVFGFTRKHHWNIALAETVTIDAGRNHALDLICEPAGPHSAPSVQALLAELKDAGFEHPKSQRLGEPGPTLWNRAGEVRGGWLVDNHGRGLPWREKLTEQLNSMKRLHEFDLTKLVISADTATRCLRAVIPRKGVQNVVIEHKDVYGALKELTDALWRAGFNVLSSLLKRGGAPKENAVLIAICEPVKLGEDDDVLRKRIEDEVRKIDEFYRAEPRITGGHLCYKVLDVKRHGDTIIHMPEELGWRVQRRKDELSQVRKGAIFLSYRISNPKTRPYVEEIREVLKLAGYDVVESPSRSHGSHGLQSSFEDVSAAMWVSDGVIVVIADADDIPVSLNLAHEFGFFQGQTKPILWLTEQSEKVEAFVDQTFSNVKGMAKPHFSPEMAMQREHQDSIASKVREWLQSFENKRQ